MENGANNGKNEHNLDKSCPYYYSTVNKSQEVIQKVPLVYKVVFKL
jgi:hypothetical protein